jgi:glycerol-3-phosphate acyltransferase PlsY
VATAGAVLIAYDWRLGLAVVVVWLTIAVVSRYSSLAAISAALFAPAAAWLLLGAGPYLMATVVMSIVLIARHHQNIRKLMRGEESRIGEKRKPVPEAAPGPRSTG